MEEIILQAEVRDEIGKQQVNRLRKKNFIPGVVYGEGKEAKAIKIAQRDLLHLMHQHRFENAVINLKIKDDTAKKGRSCLIKDVQYDPVHSTIVHVDFNEISLTKTIKINVPVMVKGESVGVKQEGGSLEHILWEIEVECLPTDIPKHIDVDISALKIGDSIHVKDVTVPQNVKILNEPEEIIVTVSAPMKEEVPVEAVEGEEKKEPEVIKEKKEVPGEGKEEEGK